MPLIKLGLLRVVRLIASVAIVCTIIAIEYHVHGLGNTTVTSSLLLAILFFAIRWDRLKRAAEALERKRETERLYELGQAMMASNSQETTVYLAINQTIRIFGVAGTAFHVRSSGVESLLLNILPGEVATILFTDFVGSTLSTEKLAARELVGMLHDYFAAFDHIVARYRLEKMKTIGDSSMCISGVPTRNPAHPVDTVLAAFEMLHAVEEWAQRGSGLGWKVPIGIHTGPVIAGVAGINKFAFDIWGDTVNYSSRMESSGAAYRINLSERTNSQVKDVLACEPRGKVLTKDKRELDNVYFQQDPPAFPDFLVNPSRGVEIPALVVA
jgi:class 3 adenylate cyclase